MSITVGTIGLVCSKPLHPQHPHRIHLYCSVFHTSAMCTLCNINASIKHWAVVAVQRQCWLGVWSSGGIYRARGRKGKKGCRGPLHGSSVCRLFGKPMRQGVTLLSVVWMPMQFEQRSALGCCAWCNMGVGG